MLSSTVAFIVFMFAKPTEATKEVREFCKEHKIRLNTNVNPLQPGVAYLYPPENIRKRKGNDKDKPKDKQHRAVMG